MEQYIGAKIIKAEPAKAIKDYGKHKAGEDGYKVAYEDGYKSWSPKDVFEKAYRRIDNMTFGYTIEALKIGKKVCRKGWNGKGMFVVYQKGYPQGIPCNKQTAQAWGINQDDLFKCEPYLQIKMANGSHSMWVPSINDVLAEDWQIVE